MKSHNKSNQHDIFMCFDLEETGNGKMRASHIDDLVQILSTLTAIPLIFFLFPAKHNSLKDRDCHKFLCNFTSSSVFADRWHAIRTVASYQIDEISGLARCHHDVPSQ